jgi:multidrug efflux pump subunit AcrA (membrane-fusion protein)
MVLLVLSLFSFERTDAIIAVVESQKTAISFRKPVKIKTIHVSAGQYVQKGDTLVTVERPDLILEQAKFESETQILLSKKSRLLSEHKSEVNLLSIEKTGKLQRIDAEINRLKAELQFNESLYTDMRSMTGNTGTNVNDSVIVLQDEEIQIASYLEEKKYLEKHYISELNRRSLLVEEDLKTLELQVDILNQEQDVLQAEKITLTQLAPFNGTIGSVNTQLQELMPPFQTIISVFAEHPTSLKAYLNLDSDHQLQVNQEVTVESFTRAYQTKGRVVEIGARIVNYQDAHKPVTPVQMFGREVFVQLPDDNDFLYGEQVYVYPISE